MPETSGTAIIPCQCLLEIRGDAESVGASTIIAPKTASLSVPTQIEGCEFNIAD